LELGFLNKTYYIQQDNRANDGHDYRTQKAACCNAQQAEYEATQYRTNNSYDNVAYGPKSSSLHYVPGQPPDQRANCQKYYQANNIHVASI